MRKNGGKEVWKKVRGENWSSRFEDGKRVKQQEKSEEAGCMVCRERCNYRK